MLILSGIAIATLTGDNGLITQAQKAKEETEGAKENEISSLSDMENMINNYVNSEDGLNDDRLGNEKIIITNVEQIYALGRISMTDSTRNGIIPNYTTNGNLQADLNIFDYPEEIRTDQEKISYLMTTSYRLENNIEIKCQKNGNESFFGIGGTERPFKGFFNGNGKVVTLSETILTLNAYGPVYIGGIFGEVNGCTIANLKVELSGNITFNQGITSTRFGIVIGKMSNSKIQNVHVTMDDKKIQALFDTASYRPNMDIGGLVANIDGSCELINCSLSLTNNSEILVTNTNDSDQYDFYVGGIVARITSNKNKRTFISNCMVNLTNSNMSIVTPNIGKCAGIVADAKYTTISNTKVIFNDASIGINSAGESYMDGNNYYSLAVGGIVGFGGAGSDNSSSSIANEGLKIDNCSFFSTNTTQKEVLYAKEISGGAPNVGGIIGLSFNNCSIKNTDVNITNGTIISERINEDSYDALGSTSGGIIGRMEHTGLIQNCTVDGNNLDIISKSTKSGIYAGGIVGIDIGPYHKNQISLQENKFIGNGTSSITVELIRGSMENSEIYAGGIAGETNYIMKNCSASGVTIFHKGVDTGVTKAAIGKLAGRFNLNTGLWTVGSYFVPETTRGIIGCKTTDVDINVEDNNSQIVSIGEECGEVN